MTGSVNDGDPVAIGLFGTVENKISRLVFGRVEGSAETVYYLDDIDVDLYSVGPTPQPTLSAALVGENLEISWEPAGGALESATDVAGPWTAVEGAVSPYAASVTEAVQMFFRVNVVGQ